MKTYGERHIEWFVIDFEAIEYNKTKTRGAIRTEIWEFVTEDSAKNQVWVLKKLYNEAYNAVVAFRYVEAYTIVE